MSDINSIQISGRIGAKPNMKYFETGSAVCEISVGVSKWSKKDNQEKTTWINCRAWNKKAEFVGEYAKSGAMVFISGSLAKEAFKDNEGKDRATSYVLIDEIKIIGKKED